MGDKDLPQVLKRWIVEELELPARDLPPDSYFRTLCLGQGADIWKYITRHVYNEGNVRIMRGNLQCYKVMQDSEVRRGEGQSEAARRRALTREIEELRAELVELDAQIEQSQAELCSDDRAVGQCWDHCSEARRRRVLLQAMGVRCAQERHSLWQDRRRISGHCQALAELARKAEVELVFGDPSDSSTDSLGSTGPEPQALREVRELCEDRLQFFWTLLESELKAAPLSGVHLSQEERSAVFQRWLSSVEDLMRTHPPSHLLAALQHLASRQQGALQEKLEQLDLSRDVAALGFRYESDHLLDLSRETAAPLPSVRLLLQEAWETVERCQVQLAAMRAQDRQQSALLQARKSEAFQAACAGDAQVEPLLRAALELELQLAMETALRDSLQRQGEALEQGARSRKEALLALQAKRQNIMDFRQLVDRKQEQIRSLIKGNSTAKSELSRVHAEVRRFVQEKLQRHQGAVEREAGALHSAVSQEVRQAAGVSLDELDRRLLDGVQRVPARKLSVHRLDCPALRRVSDGLGFALYKAPEQLMPLAVSMQLELRFLRRLLHLHTTCMQHRDQQVVLLPAQDMEAMLQRVRTEDQARVRDLLPRVRLLSQRSAQCLGYGAEVKRAISHWWEQPGQFVLPDQRRGGLTLQQWLERWRLAAKGLQ